MYAAAGALAGFGKGIEEVAMAKLKAQYVADQRATDLAGDKELATYKDSLADGNKTASGGGGGGGRRSSGGGSSSSGTTATAAGGGKLTYVQPNADGILVGQDKAGNWVPAKDATTGEPIKVPPKGAKDSKDPLGSGTVVEPGTTPQRPADPSPARPAAPKAGDAVGGHTFKGGDPNDQKNWEPVSSAERPDNSKVAQNDDIATLYEQAKAALARFKAGGSPDDLHAAAQRFIDAASGNPQWQSKADEVNYWFDDDANYNSPALISKGLGGKTRTA
jgi:hypothetical protein